MEKVCEAVLMEIDVEMFHKAMAEIDIKEASARKSIDIEKIREVASAHYEDLTEEQKQAARKFFEAMDTDKSGNISADEFMTFLSLAGLQTDNHDWLFAELDKDNNGFLDFKELVTFFYVVSRDEYKDLLKCTPHTDVPDRKAKIGRRTVGANDLGRGWSKRHYLESYNNVKRMYKPEGRVNQNECSIV